MSENPSNEDAGSQRDPAGPRSAGSRLWIPISFLCLLVGVGGGLLAARLMPGGSHDHGGGGEEAAAEIWTCPMHPTVISDRFGACPVCGMDLVKKLADDGGGHDPAELVRLGRVAINPTKRVLGNVALSKVETRVLHRSFRAPAQIVHDEQGLETISAWIGGRVEALHVEETGTKVKKGQKLLTIYSPALVTAQEELLAASRGGEFTRSLRDQAVRKLRLWGMSRGQIARVERRGKPMERVVVYAPADGTVTERMIRQGQYVTEGQALLSLSTLSRVWLEANVYEKDIPYVEEGAEIDFTVSSLPGRTFVGRVELLHPVLDRATRTMRVRASFPNPDGLLRPGMYAVANFEADVSPGAVAVVPVTAVIRTGKRAVVYVEVETGVYEQRKVELGPRAEDAFVVLSGVKAGDLVVSSGGFLVDSEAQLMAGAYAPSSQPASAPDSAPNSAPDSAPDSAGMTDPDNGPASGADTKPVSMPAASPDSEQGGIMPESTPAAAAEKPMTSGGKMSAPASKGKGAAASGKKGSGMSPVDSDAPTGNPSSRAASKPSDKPSSGAASKPSGKPSSDAASKPAGGPSSAASAPSSAPATKAGAASGPAGAPSKPAGKEAK